MTFAYSYKTSDGVRHEDAIRAKSKEDVFQTLRNKGIRPIKVTPKGLQPERLVKWSLLFFGVCAVGIFIGSRMTIHTELAVDEDATLLPDCDLVKTVKALTGQYRETVENYERNDIDHNSLKSLQDAIQVVKQAEGITVYYRKLVKSAFLSAARETADEDSRIVQRYYGEVMGAYDLEETRLKGQHYALALLVDNHGSWECVTTNGEKRIVFSSPDIQREYDFYTSSADADSLRWRKDFVPDSE